MPSKKPRLMTYTEQETIDKFETISKQENRSMSKQLEYIIKKYIQEYESKNGSIIIQNNSHFGDININK